MFASKISAIRDNINKRVILYIDDTQEFLTLYITQPSDYTFCLINPACDLGAYLKNKRPASYFLSQGRSEYIEHFAKTLFEHVNTKGFVPEFSTDENLIKNIGDIFLYDYYRN